MRLLTQKQIDDVRRRCKTGSFQPAYQKLKADAKAFLALKMTPPESPAGLYHDYFCPEHGVELSFDPAAPNRHRCPAGQERFSGEPYDSAWNWFVNNRLSVMAFKLALLWQIDGEAREFRRVEEILLGYAARYRDYPLGEERVSGRGKATFQPLDEAVWLIPLVQAYDLIRAHVSGDVRRRVEDGLIWPAADHILSQKYFRIHNIECWLNAALGTVGISLGEDTLVRVAVEKAFGLRHQLAEGVRDDGLWWEGSSSYHFYALAALMTLARNAQASDESLWKTTQIKEMFRAPVALAYPDLSLPATNDCWFFSSLKDDVCHGVPPASGFYEGAYAWYEDLIFAWVLNLNYKARPRETFEALLYGRELPDTRVRIRPGGTHFDTSGFAILRSADPPGRQSSLLLKYGPSGGGHGHPDKLAISFYLSGHPVSPDLGTPGYGIDLHRSWYRQSVSHNTVVVDGCSQPPADGEVVAYESGIRSDYGVADARVSWEEGPYRGIRMRRSLLWMQDYHLDLFEVRGARTHQFDWVCRFRGQFASASGLADEAPVLLEGEGYGHISNPKAAIPGRSVRLAWALPGGGFALHLPLETESTLIRGRAPYNPASESCDLLIRRRRCSATTFVGLVHAWKGHPSVSEVNAIDAPGGVLALSVVCAGERHLWIISKEVDKGTLSHARRDADRVLTYVL